MKLFLGTVGLPDAWSAKQAFEALGRTDTRGRHHLTPDPVEADMILFTECHQLPGDWALRTIVNSPMARQFPEKVFVYDERDRPWCRLPGLYVSMPRSAFQTRWQRAWAYPPARLAAWHDGAETTSPELLFSLVASPTHPARELLFRLSHPRGLVERVEGFVFFDSGSSDFEARQQRFREVLTQSKFVLCPRGAGTSSIRLFETMRAGRVPVVISDDWMPPAGPDWERFIVRWPERDAQRLLPELERREDEAAVMGALAKQAYMDWFAPETSLDRLVTLLGELLPARAGFPACGVIDQRWGRLAVHSARTRTVRRARLLRNSLPGKKEGSR